MIMAGGANQAFRRYRRFFTVVTLLKLCAVSFYLGYRNAVYQGNYGNGNAASAGAAFPGCDAPTGVYIKWMRNEIDARVKEELSRYPPTNISKSARHQIDANAEQIKDQGYTGSLFPPGAGSFAVGALRVPREELMREYDFGVPFKHEDKDVDAILIYNTRRSLPSDEKLRLAAQSGEGGGIAPAGVPDAMGNCDTLNVIFTSLQKRSSVHECMVLIGGFEGYNINRWARIPVFTEGNKKHRQLNRTLPLRHIGRVTLLERGIDEFDLPNVWDGFHRRRGKGKKDEVSVMSHLDRLKVFLDNVDSVQKDLKKLLERRGVVRNNTVVVMTVNNGQSELLANFVCNARSKGLDTGGILVFPTDEKSHKLAQGLGLASYFDKKNLGVLPSGEARQYGDHIFASMMYAKVLCVLYVSLLGHAVLFQDVDLVWFKDPLAFFHDENNKVIRDFDIFFQHDGNSQQRYNPLSANSGFYYARAHKKVQYLFASLLYHGDIVRKSKSHQQVLVQLLNEHSSLFGLRVKVFDKRLTDEFPGGYHFHQDWDAMRDIVAGKSNAYVLHMSWTENKDNKILFFRQLGEWHLREQCIGDGAREMAEGAKDGGLVEQCCSKEPIFSCHFIDKPSKRPCPDSPKIDPKRGRPFWK